MATHVQTHDGLERIVRGTETLGRVVGSGTQRLAQRPLVARLATLLGSVAGGIYRAMIAAREARALEELDRYDWRLAAEVRAARGRDEDEGATRT